MGVTNCATLAANGRRLRGRVEQAFRPALRRPFENYGLQPLRSLANGGGMVQATVPQRLKPDAMDAANHAGLKPCSTRSGRIIMNNPGQVYPALRASARSLLGGGLSPVNDCIYV